MKILHILSVLFLTLFASYAYAAKLFLVDGVPVQEFKVTDDLKTAIPDLPSSVRIYDPDGKASEFEVKNPDGIGVFHFGDKCLLSNSSPVKFLARAIQKDVSSLDTWIYVEYTGGVSLKSLSKTKAAFCPEHTVVTMPLKDYMAFHKIMVQVEEEKKYLRTMLIPARVEENSTK